MLFVVNLLTILNVIHKGQPLLQQLVTICKQNNIIVLCNLQNLEAITHGLKAKQVSYRHIIYVQMYHICSGLCSYVEQCKCRYMTNSQSDCYCNYTCIKSSLLF